jgi:hypothetical protein
MRPPLIPQLVPVHEHDPKHIKIMKSCYNHLVEYREPKTNRIIISLFMCLPSRKDFSKYFDIIKRPISMYEIRKRIEQGHYRSEEDCIEDFKLMFNNCRYFNEDDSQIFRDAVKLEEMLFDKYKQLKRENGGTNGGTPRHVANTHSNSNNNSNNVNTNNVNGIPSDLDSNSNSNISCNQEDIMLCTNDALSSSIASPLSESKPTKRPKRDSDAPKKRLLTGYIIYAAEVRKEYVDKNPNQDFGFISRLIGNDWKALSSDLKKAYEQRAQLHNEKALRNGMMLTPDVQSDASPNLSMTNGTKTPKMTKRRLAKLAREQARMNKSSTPYMNHQGNQFSSPLRQQDGRPSQMVPQTSANSTYKSSDYYNNSRYAYSMQQSSGQQTYNGKPMTTETATQTAPIRFVEPPTRRRFAYYENFRRYIESLEVTNKDLLAEETAVPPNERISESASKWLGAGIGRYESEEAALWGLRDFMLQDSGTMRWNMQPYLY